MTKAKAKGRKGKGKGKERERERERKRQSEREEEKDDVGKERKKIGKSLNFPFFAELFQISQEKGEQKRETEKEREGRVGVRTDTNKTKKKTSGKCNLDNEKEEKILIPGRSKV